MTATSLQIGMHFGPTVWIARTVGYRHHPIRPPLSQVDIELFISLFWSAVVFFSSSAGSNFSGSFGVVLDFLFKRRGFMVQGFKFWGFGGPRCVTGELATQSGHN